MTPAPTATPDPIAISETSRSVRRTPLSMSWNVSSNTASDRDVSCNPTVHRRPDQVAVHVDGDLLELDLIGRAPSGGRRRLVAARSPRRSRQPHHRRRPAALIRLYRPDGRRVCARHVDGATRDRAVQPLERAAAEARSRTTAPSASAPRRSRNRFRESVVVGPTPRRSRRSAARRRSRPPPWPYVRPRRPPYA